ncbi:TPA: hypothetical protein N0F65_011303 [Lagenidium giganteum]|uniref:malate synthase n=1 Tax=Lagenidium giganteum TaxID=4803 RepID=A0AAV2YG24_9STRA|nr:TPA: hypothetical protein N0F65_011303 [Lagenidium giganteum]
MAMSAGDARSKGKRFRKHQNGASNLRSRWKFLSAQTDDVVPGSHASALSAALLRRQAQEAQRRKAQGEPGRRRANVRRGYDIDGDGSVDMREMRVSKILDEMLVRHQSSTASEPTDSEFQQMQQKAGRLLLAREFVERNKGCLWRYGSIFVEKSEDESVQFIAQHKKFRKLITFLESTERKRAVRSSQNARACVGPESPRDQFEHAPHYPIDRRTWVETPKRVEDATFTKYPLPELNAHKENQTNVLVLPDAVDNEKLEEVQFNKYGAIDVDGDGIIDLDEMRLNTRLKEATLEDPENQVITQQIRNQQRHEGRNMMARDFVARNQNRMQPYDPKYTGKPESEIVAQIANSERFAIELNRLRAKERVFTLKSSLGVSGCLVQLPPAERAKDPTNTMEFRRVKDRTELLAARKQLMLASNESPAARSVSAPRIRVREDRSEDTQADNFNRTRSEARVGLPRLYDTPVRIEPTSSFSVTKWLLQYHCHASLRQRTATPQATPTTMERIARVQQHLRAANAAGDSKQSIFVAPCDASLDEDVYKRVLTREAIEFVVQIVQIFGSEIDDLFQRRVTRRHRIQHLGEMPGFLDSTRHIREDPTWKVARLPPVLQDRRVDIGDAAPCNTDFLIRALNSGAQGVQVDFDDGNCPTWANTINGHHNIMQAVRGTLALPGSDLRLCANPALLLVRPRAWNMDEMARTSIRLSTSWLMAALCQGLCSTLRSISSTSAGKVLYKSGRGPFLYLPKLESHEEARLWRQIFQFTEQKLRFPRGCIKALVLIENIFAAFEMEEILYELRHYSLGLNCGMWDYTASLVVNFRHLKSCVLPDRQKFVSMKTDFLRHYMDLLINTCKRRNAPATTGMVPFVLSELPPELSQSEAIARARAAKRFEAEAGSDGALVYDIALVQAVQEEFSVVFRNGATPAPIAQPVDEPFFERVLVTMPSGFVSTQSVELNARVALLYALQWFLGQGTVIVNGCVEGSATAEISRAQLWQWVRYQVPLSDKPGYVVNAQLVHDVLLRLAREQVEKQQHSIRNIVAAINLVFRLVTMRTPPSFITTFLLEQDPLTKSLQ